MSGFSVARGRLDPRVARRVSVWERYYLRKGVLPDFGCAIFGVFAAAQLRFENHVTGTYIVLSLALPVLWIGAVWLAGGYDARFIGIGSDEYRKVLNAGVGLTVAGRDRYQGLAGDGGIRPPAPPVHGFSRCPATEPLVSRVRRSTTACLKAHNCALPGARSRDCDQGIRPAPRMQGGGAKHAAAER
jgi:hypothetical protein